MVYGTSASGIIALEAAARGLLPITRLAVWEPPYIADGSRPAVPTLVLDGGTTRWLSNTADVGAAARPRRSGAP
jgi:hypothetical protein